MKLKIGEVAKCRFVIIIVKSFVFAKVTLSIANQACYSNDFVMCCENKQKNDATRWCM